MARFGILTLISLATQGNKPWKRKPWIANLFDFGLRGTPLGSKGRLRKLHIWHMLALPYPATALLLN
eukprot:1390152-Amphidinium_carterae.1